MWCSAHSGKMISRSAEVGNQTGAFVAVVRANRVCVSLCSLTPLIFPQRGFFVLKKNDTRASEK